MLTGAFWGLKSTHFITASLRPTRNARPARTRSAAPGKRSGLLRPFSPSAKEAARPGEASLAALAVGWWGMKSGRLWLWPRRARGLSPPPPPPLRSRSGAEFHGAQKPQGPRRSSSPTLCPRQEAPGRCSRRAARSLTPPFRPRESRAS